MLLFVYFEDLSKAKKDKERKNKEQQKKKKHENENYYLLWWSDKKQYFLYNFSTVSNLFVDPMQKWLPLNYSFVCIQRSLTNLVQDNKIFTLFVSKMRLVRLI